MNSNIKLSRWLVRLSLLSAISVFILIGVGAFTRLSNAGLGCPDWPACYGHWLVSHATNVSAHSQVIKAQIEMVHRYLAAIVSIPVMSVIILCVFSANYLGVSFVFYALSLSCLLFAQIVLGMLTVTLKLSPIMVVSHLLVGMLILSILWWIYLRARQIASGVAFERASIGLRVFGFCCVMLLFMQIVLGGWTSSHYAGLICHGLLACKPTQALSYDYHNAFLSNQLVLPDGALMTIQVAHRWGALIVGLSLFSLFLWVKRAPSSQQNVKKIAHYLLMLLALQIMIGMLNVVWQLPLWLALAHNMVAAIMLLILMTVYFYLSHQVVSQ